MFKYLVVHVTTEPCDPGGFFEGSIDEEDSQTAEVKGVILCRDGVEVATALKKAEKSGFDWAVYEMNAHLGTTERRSVVFGKSGKSILRFE
jgi:hypothetical protein